MGDYFSTLGKIPTPAEYKALENTPYRFITLMRMFKNWRRLKNQIGPLEDFQLTDEQREEKARVRAAQALINDLKAKEEEEETKLQNLQAAIQEKDEELKAVEAAKAEVLAQMETLQKSIEMKEETPAKTTPVKPPAKPEVK